MQFHHYENCHRSVGLALHVTADTQPQATDVNAMHKGLRINGWTAEENERLKAMVDRGATRAAAAFGLRMHRPDWKFSIVSTGGAGATSN
ncbi:MAG: hypothetical protein JWR89_5208 [Tardiphaga sp.]|uniref:hypothetical protein n=1 Tax=Tardiphaga sp. TaxID=1926292 RepID=UPI00263183EC|nr:hypothetical protein [Tardiphaga sp.]MDB5505306.1 hypothetical protein [Tardiphaga sp.]